MSEISWKSWGIKCSTLACVLIMLTYLECFMNIYIKIKHLDYPSYRHELIYFNFQVRGLRGERPAKLWCLVL